MFKLASLGVVALILFGLTGCGGGGGATTYSVGGTINGANVTDVQVSASARCLLSAGPRPIAYPPG